jgi:hypothetical protein
MPASDVGAARNKTLRLSLQARPTDQLQPSCARRTGLHSVVACTTPAARMIDGPVGAIGGPVANQRTYWAGREQELQLLMARQSRPPAARSST